MLRIQIRKRLDNDLQFFLKVRMHVVLLKSNSFIFLDVWLKNTLSFLTQTYAFEIELLFAIIFLLATYFELDNFELFISSS